MPDQKNAKGGTSQQSAQGAPSSKMDAVRRILAERGMDTMPTEIQKLVKERFGLDITKDHVSVCKTEIRHQGAKTTATSRKPGNKEAKPRSHVQPAPTAAAPAIPAGGGQASKAPITKMDAMRQALSELGKDAQPLAIQSFLKSHFGLEMPRDLISKYKSDLARAKAPKPMARPVTRPLAASKKVGKKIAPRPTPASATAAPVLNSANGIDLEDIQTVQALVARVGAEQFRKLIDLLGK